jgi:hypothetical protein
MPINTIREALRSSVLLLILASAAVPAIAQFQTEFNYVFSPANPLPGNEVSVFIRGTDPVNGFVLCPGAARVITRVQVESTTILLDLSPFLIAGGEARPYCDGNTVSLGALPAGLYTVTARSVFPDGRVGPTLLTRLLAVGPMQVPSSSPLMLCVLATLTLLIGTRWSAKWLRRRPKG